MSHLLGLHLADFVIALGRLHKAALGVQDANIAGAVLELQGRLLAASDEGGCLLDVLLRRHRVVVLQVQHADLHVLAQPVVRIQLPHAWPPAATGRS